MTNSFQNHAVVARHPRTSDGARALFCLAINTVESQCTIVHSREPGAPLGTAEAGTVSR